jgi:hypothetical protein
MSFDPELPLGAKVRSAHIGQRAIAPTVAQHPQDTHARLDIDLPRGDVALDIGYSGGVAIVPAAPRPVVGSGSRAMKVVSARLNDRVYTIELDHLASEPLRFELRTPWKIEDVRGATFEVLTPSSYRFEIDAAANERRGSYRRSKVIVTFVNVTS